MSSQKDPAASGSIMYLMSTERFYGVEAVLALPTEYFIYDRAALNGLRSTDSRAHQHNIIAGYFGLCGDQSPESARVEAGVQKNSGDDSNRWYAYRCGLNGHGNHRTLYGEHEFPHNKCKIRLCLLDNETAAFWVNGRLIHSAYRLGLPISRESYDAGGLYIKLALGVINWGGKIWFNKMTFYDIKVTDTPDFRTWQWMRNRIQKSKLTLNDKFKTSWHPFAISYPPPNRAAHRG